MLIFLLALLKNWLAIGQLDSAICSERCSEVAGSIDRRAGAYKKWLLSQTLGLEDSHLLV